MWEPGLKFKKSEPRFFTGMLLKKNTIILKVYPTGKFVT